MDYFASNSIDYMYLSYHLILCKIMSLFIKSFILLNYF